MKEVKSYEYMHLLVKKARGRAAEYPCVGCGGPARHWALRHDAGHLRVQEGTTDEGKVFSLDVDAYDPMCHKCHSAYDQKHGMMRGPIGNHSSNPRGWHVRGYMHESKP